MFLIARELRIKRAQPLGLHALDTALLAVLAGVMIALTVWVDL